MRSVILPGRTRKPHAGSTAPEPSVAIGTTGTCSATWNTPPFNGRTYPSRLRAPSGNAHRLAPPRTSDTTACKRSAASRARPRWMNTMPIARAYPPTNQWTCRRRAWKRAPAKAWPGLRKTA